MRTVFTLLCCIMAALLSANAQSNNDEHIKKIQQAYQSRLALMQNQPYDDIKVEQMSVSYNRMYPGTGLYRHTDTYYWLDDEDEEYMLRPRLYFVTSRYSLCHDRYRFYREYLFDAETGEPMFMLLTTQLHDDVGSRREYRFYFHNGRIIRQIPAKIEIPDSPDSPDFIMPDIDIDPARLESGLLMEFSNVKQIFDRNVPTMAW
ncbi:MAG: hypothetical protein IJ626_02260 [Muribaculaceae bacterium]|nr:hypothetical protein [Muribaculaceae bacterium]